MNASAECPISVPLPDGLTLCEDGLVRPTWASHDRLLRDYYDSEWGVPVHDEAGVFERLALEGFQAGLSWRTVLAKRDAFREAFAGFRPDAVAAFTDEDIEHLVSNPAIIRNRRKIEAAITNARATLALRDVDEATPPTPPTWERSCGRIVPMPTRIRPVRSRFPQLCPNRVPWLPT